MSMSSLGAPERLVPLQKVCPRCSTISRTDAQSCPHCGKDYRRRSVLMTVLVTLLWLCAGWMLFSFLAMALINP
jgi:ribosomal protein L40E